MPKRGTGRISTILWFFPQFVAYDKLVEMTDEELLSVLITSEMLDLPEIETINLLNEQESYVITCPSKLERVYCPTCGCPSSSVHSYYNRIIQDLPIAGKTVYLKLIQRRFRCQSSQCSTGFFTQSFSFVASKGKKTIRLEALIQRSSLGMSTVQATSFLKAMGIRNCKSTLSQLLKKSN